MGALINLKGEKFGKLAVLYYEAAISRWICRCDCGIETPVRSACLRRGQTTSCSTACHWVEAFQKTTALHNILDVYKRVARNKGLLFELTKEQFKHFLSSNCHYCNALPSGRHKRKGKVYLYTGLDRIDSSLGYSLENVWPCCKQCNIAKNNLSQNEFYEWAIRVYSHLSSIAAYKLKG